MKKICILGVCALMGMGAMAQETVLKDAKKAVGKQSFDEVVKILTPAFSDPATANNPETYFLAGKAGMEYWKKMDTQGRAQEGGLSEADGLKAAQALLGGYDYLMKAIELDGKAAKPKYTKDAIKLITENFNGFNTAGVYFFNGKDFMGAYNAWDVFVNLPESPLFSDNKLLAAMVTPEMKIDLYYNQGISAFQAQDFDKALAGLNNSIAAGNDNKTAYDYALYSAIQTNDPEKIRAAAQQGYEKFGKEDSQYIGQIINGYLTEKNFSQALSLIDQAIADSPEVSQYYFIKGIVQEQPEIGQDPMASYQKAVELDPKNDNAWYQMAYNMYLKAGQISENAPVNQAEFDKVKKEQIDPLLRQVIEYGRKAYVIRRDNDGDLHDVQTMLKNAYYELGEDYNQKMSDIL